MSDADDPDQTSLSSAGGRRRQEIRVKRNEPAQSEIESEATDAPKLADDDVVILGAPGDKDYAPIPEEDRPWDELKRPLTAAFLAALGVGMVAEVIGGNSGTIGAVIAMVVYFLFGISRPKNQRNTERFADSLYYLGFILTLAALFMAMVPWFQGGRDLTSRTIIEKFGVAILTTFIGMSLRIILIQLRTTVSDQQEEARESIAKYVGELTLETQTTIGLVREFRRNAIGDAAEAAKEFARQMQQIGATSGEAVTNSNAIMLRSVQRIEMSIAQVSDRIANAGQEFDRQMQHIRTRSGEAIANLDAVVLGGVRRIEMSMGEVGDRIADAGQEFARQMQQIGATSGEAIANSNGILLQSVRQIATRLKDSADAMSREIERLQQSLHEATGMFTQAMKGSVNSMEQVSGDVDRLHMAIASANQSVGATAALAATTTRDAQRFAENASQASSAMQDLRQQASDFARAICDLGKLMQRRGDEHDGNVTKVTAELNAVKQEVKETGEAFVSAVTSSADALRAAIRDAGRP